METKLRFIHLAQSGKYTISELCHDLGAVDKAVAVVVDVGCGPSAIIGQIFGDGGVAVRVVSIGDQMVVASASEALCEDLRYAGRSRFTVADLVVGVAGGSVRAGWIACYGFAREPIKIVVGGRSGAEDFEIRVLNAYPVPIYTDGRRRTYAATIIGMQISSLN